MPNWRIHLEIGKQIGKLINYDDKDLELFLFGNILPDINNCYLVKDISKKIDHDDTHFKNTNNSTYQAFYEEYKDKIKENPVVFGYFTHLYTDYIWNQDFYQKCKKRKDFTDQPHDQLARIKQEDFKVYNDLYIDNKLTISSIELLLEKSSIVTRVDVNEKDIRNVVKFLDSREKSNLKFKFYTLKELNSLKKQTIQSIQRFQQENILI